MTSFVYENIIDYYAIKVNTLNSLYIYLNMYIVIFHRDISSMYSLSHLTKK